MGKNKKQTNNLVLNAANFEGGLKSRAESHNSVSSLIVTNYSCRNFFQIMDFGTSQKHFSYAEMENLLKVCSEFHLPMHLDMVL